ncbi:MAG: transcriptional repressor [Alicyclobacillaceae bacterium]|nr:transcriptional repressor [Alicyclobacillaceae bacterium]
MEWDSAERASSLRCSIDRTQLVTLLHGQNFRLTREREAVLRLFVQAGKMLTPAQLHELARRQTVHVGLTTVYRLLEVLTKVGLATPFLLDGSVYYTFCHQPHHHHCICLSCHAVQDIYECPTPMQPPGEFAVAYHRVDWFGICKQCSTAQGGFPDG